jgi:hypothetical protein
MEGRLVWGGVYGMGGDALISEGQQDSGTVEIAFMKSKLFSFNPPRINDLLLQRDSVL